MNENDERFVAIGNLHLDGALRFVSPNTVFDIGCGYGRMAYALHSRGFKGRYAGVDILPRQIAWLRENFTASGFAFDLVDVRNERYNPKGTLTTEEAVLDPGFQPDLTFVLSVFTHMYDVDIESYLRKMRRIMLPGSVAYVSVFSLGGDQGRRPYGFPHRLNDHCAFHNEADPLHAIAFDEEWLRGLFARTGLVVHDFQHSFQDMVALKPME